MIKKNILIRPVNGITDKLIIQGIINTNSTSKTRYNKPIKKYCKSKILFNPNGSKPHSY